MNFFKKAKKGFTLVELVVVIAVIAILAAVSVGAYFGVTESANNSKAEQEAKQAYTQLQTKTLAGLGIERSGTSVTLGNNGLTFAGIYEAATVKEYSDLIFDEGQEIDINVGTLSLENVEPSENSRVYFFAKESGTNALATHMGYIPANLSGKYAKYISLNNGEILDSEKIDFTIFKENNFEANHIIKETITLGNFDFSACETGYNFFGSSIDTLANYEANLFIGDSGANNTIGDLAFQFKKYGNAAANKYGIFVKDTKGFVRAVSTDWKSNHSYNTIDDIISVHGTYATSYLNTNTQNLPEDKLVGEINYPNSFTNISGKNCYVRLSVDSAVYLNSVSFYYQSDIDVTKLVKSVSLDQTDIVTSDMGNNITLTPTILPETAENKACTWESSDLSIATVDENGVVTPKNYGTVTIICISVDNPGAKASCNITFKELKNYTSGLINSEAQLVDGLEFVIGYKAGNYLMSYAESSIIEPLDVTTLGENLNDNSVSYSNMNPVMLLTLKEVNLADDIKVYALETEDGKYLRIDGNSNNNLLIGDLNKNAQGTEDLGAYWYIEVDDDCNAHITNAEHTTRLIQYNKASNANYFSTYKGTQQPVQIFANQYVTDANISKIHITSANTQVLEGKSVSFIVDRHYPSFSEPPVDIMWTSSKTEVATISNDGTLNALAEGTTDIKATITVGGKNIDSNVITVTVTKDTRTDGYYELTDLEELNNKSKVIITASNNNIAISTACSSDGKTIKATNITKDSNGKATFNDVVSVFSVERNIENNTYLFKNPKGKYLKAEIISNYSCLTYGEKDAGAEWTVTYDATGLTLISNISSDYKDLRTYAANNYFNLNKTGGSYEQVRIYGLFGTYEPEVHTHEYEGGICRCGEKDPNAVEPTKYVISNYTAGTQYAKNEEHVLDENCTIYTTDCHFTTQLRIYSSKTNNGYAIFKFNKNVTYFTLNVGYKKDTLKIYYSDDEGTTWEELTDVTTTSTSYLDYGFDAGSHKMFKMDVVGTQQIRISNFSVTYQG